MKPIAVDPWGCGCTECVTGEYKPLSDATDDDIADLLAGRLRDNTHTGCLVVSVSYRVGRDERSRITMEIDTVTVSVDPMFNYGPHTRTWEPDPYRAGLAA